MTFTISTKIDISAEKRIVQKACSDILVYDRIAYIYIEDKAMISFENERG